MPNLIDASGLQVATYEELQQNFRDSMESIYGTDINLDSDTPDGQMMNIFIQAVLDLEDLLVQINNMFDPDNAVGVILDQRVAINGIQRQAGTYTVTPITVVATQPCNLYGLDQVDEEVYTVEDNAGNKWLLEETQNIPGAGSYSYSFRAETPGANLTVPNTITIPVTIVLGVLSVNNPTTYTSLGVNEETDAALKVRRQKSVSLASQGYLAGLLAALENINGVTSAFVYENTGDDTDGDGVPGHSIWVIVAGTGDPEEIAQAIYTKRNAGCGMYGAESYIITQVNGSQFVVYWDDVVTEDLFIKFTATSIDGVNPPDIAAIRAGLPSGFVPGVNGEVNITALGTAVQAIDPNCLVTDAGFGLSENGPWFNTLSPSAKNKQFIVSSENIIITPMILSPVFSIVESGETQQFTGVGGWGLLAYTITVNNSGGSIDLNTGLYTAGPTPDVEDTIRVSDGLAQFGYATVSVV